MTSLVLTDDKGVSTLKATLCKNLSDEDFAIFLHVCKSTGLDPFIRQIYAVARVDGKTGKAVMTIQTGIDGLRLIAERTGKYSPGKESTYTYDDKGNIFSSTAYVMKMTPDGTWHEVAAKAYWKEYVQTFRDKNTGQNKPSNFWEKMPHLMLAKCAESLALKKAFPAEMCNMLTDDEMGQADNPKEGKNIEDANVETAVSQSIEDKKELDAKLEEQAFISKDELEHLEAVVADDVNLKNLILRKYSIDELSKIPQARIDAGLIDVVKKMKQDRLKQEKENEN